MNACRICIPVLGVFVGGCVIGPSVRSFAPGGTEVTVATMGLASVKGELLSVDSAGMLMVLGPDQPVTGVARVRFTDMRRARAKHGPSWGARSPDSAQMRRLLLLSRFPQGLSEELLAKVLRAYGQDTLWYITR